MFIDLETYKKAGFLAQGASFDCSLVDLVSSKQGWCKYNWDEG